MRFSHNFEISAKGLKFNPIKKSYFKLATMYDLSKVIRKFSKPDISSNVPITRASNPQVLFFFSDTVTYKNFRSKRYKLSVIGQFYEVVRPLVILGNFIGMIPLKKFYSKEPLFIKFSWKSLQFFYSVVVQICMFTLLATSFLKQVLYEVEYYKLRKLF